ncbi:MAG: hypothetical protein AB7U20_20440, partial [Planctomycetaceae bacterium]
FRSYLQHIEQDPATPNEVRELLPYETGVTLLAGSRLLRNPDARTRQLDEAQACFERFVSASPDHPLAGQANTERARILLDKALVEVWQADAPSNQGSHEAFRQRARTLISLARDVFQKAHDQHQAAWEQVKGFIPEEEMVKRAERAKIEGLYMQAQVDLARCTYEEAQTYDAGSDRRNELLNAAAAQFETIHQKYRSQIAGLHARMWQGKCFEEQDDIRKALGIYNEILEHPGDQLLTLQDRVRWFRLICLNHDSRKDYQLVVEEATAWKKDARDRLRTTAGLGILYELARAQQAIASSERSMSEVLKTDLLKQALENAQSVARYPGPLKAPAGALAQRLLVSLNREAGDPQDFDTAFGAANLQLEESKQLSSRIDAAQTAGDAQQVQDLQQTLHATAGEMVRLYDLALRLATPRTDPDQLNLARFRLAYAYFLQESYLEAGVLADYVARKFSQTAPQIAVESAYIALAAFDRLFSAADPANREFEMQQVMGTARFIAENWPESDRAVDARMAVARLYRHADEPQQAAEWYAQVPATVRKYAEAQLSAGQSYWNAYLTRAALPADERPPGETLADWLQKAEQHLVTGIERREQQVSADGPTPDDLALAKLSLVQIRNRQGVYTDADGQRGAVELLTKSPHAVIDAVRVPPGEARPTPPGAVRSQAMASLAYQQLLRAQIGMRDLEAARQTRQSLEAIAGEGTDAGALTQVYVEFGRELERELEQLQSAGELERLNDVRSAFESFLNDLFERKEGQTFSSLLWIAETYTGLAEGSAEEGAKSNAYFDKAASTYDEIIHRAAEQPDFVQSPGQLVAVKLRLVNCRRQQGDFAAADQVIHEVLEERPDALDAQIEAAQLYEAWAAAGAGDAAEQLQLAIQGQQGEGPVWGWEGIARRLQRAIEFDAVPEDYRAKHVDARYHLARCEFELADEQTSNEDMREHLNAARFGIQRFVAITDQLPEADWQRFNKLYQQVLKGLGEPGVPLARRTDASVSDPDHRDAVHTAESTNVPSERPGSAAALPTSPQRGSSNLLAILLLIALGVGMIGGICVMTVRQDRKRRSKFMGAAGASSEDNPKTRTVSRTRR